MPLITIGFSQDINVSIQVGDLAWYIPTNVQGAQGNQYNTNDIDNVVLIGPVTNINGNDSKDKVELFSVASEVFESSK